jgi:SAM-dependent methyltransferase
MSEMRDIEGGVSKHYAGYDVLARIRAGLTQMGLDPDRVSPEALKPVDEFHIGGAEATAALLAKLDIRPETEVLDIGSGIGGPARMIAGRYECRVTGIDLSPISSRPPAPCQRCRAWRIASASRWEAPSRCRSPIKASTWRCSCMSA